MHQLYLQFPNTPRKDAIVIMDTSSYDVNMPVVNRIIEIKLPGLTLVKKIVLPDGPDQFLKSITLQDLGFTENFSSFSDGIYSIRYSVAPNSKVNKEFFHFRRTDFDELYYLLLSKIKFNPSGCSCENHAAAIEQLKEAKMMVDAVEVLVETKCVLETSMENYECAYKMLVKLHNNCI